MTLLKSLAARVTKVSFKVPLGTLLVVLFVLQIFATVGLTGCLSLRHWRQAVNEFTSQLRYELGDRIHQKLRNYLEVPQILNQLHADTIRRGEFNLQDTGSLTTKGTGNREWGTVNLSAGKPTWSEIYLDFKQPRLKITYFLKGRKVVAQILE